MAHHKPNVTRTFAPIHFEDLDPHRFEDLIRELIYDFKDWQSIEATGRSGDDAGFDIRAFERISQSIPDDDGESSEPAAHPMDGPRWMIQVKREKTLTPSDVKRILKDVDPNDPPYGYILAASAVFSKKSYDAFRDELRKKGVMEFHLWGRAELEDMLHLPKNDRILFTFFGISLVSRRRSRAAEVRATVTVKNKLHKVLGAPHSRVNRTVLIRDINDIHYPFKDEYPDFEKEPRWIERTILHQHPNGLLIRNREFFAMVDRRTKEFDYTEHANSLVSQRRVLSKEERDAQWQRQREVFAVWNFLPRALQGKFLVDAFLPYEHILLVDAEGDGHHQHPHLYAEFGKPRGPYSHFTTHLTNRGEEIELDDSWRHVDFFPKRFPHSLPKPRVHKTRTVTLNDPTLKGFLDYSDHLDTLFAVDDHLDFLQQRDIVAVAGSARPPAGIDRLIQVLHVQKCPFGEYLKGHQADHRVRQAAKRQIGRELADGEIVTILEIEATIEPAD
jgi:Restriction endonuclease